MTRRKTTTSRATSTQKPLPQRSLENGGFSPAQYAFMQAKALYTIAQEDAQKEYPEKITKEKYNLLSEEEADSRFQKEEDADTKHDVPTLRSLLKEAKWNVCEWGLESGIEYARRHNKPEEATKELEGLLEKVKNKTVPLILLDKLVELNMNLDSRTNK